MNRALMARAFNAPRRRRVNPSGYIMPTFIPGTARPFCVFAGSWIQN